MNYQFPTIMHIDDVLPHVANHPDFFVAERDGFTVINYVAMSSDTFRPFTGDDDLGNAIRRECRGIIFDSETGDIIRRPYHKFFNFMEREETLLDKIDLSKPHKILQKLDGSMIVPFIAKGQLRWGTKMGVTDIGLEVEDYVRNTEYEVFAKTQLFVGLSPIFEWMSPTNRIVIRSDKKVLTLTAIRDIHSGKYIPYEEMLDIVKFHCFDIPVVKQYEGTVENMEMLHASVRNEVDNEGWVIRFDDGHMIKMKSDWYVAIHKAKDNLLFERNVITLILDEKVDDILPFLIDLDRERLMEYNDHFLKQFEYTVSRIRTVYMENWAPNKGDFARNYAAKSIYSAILFKIYDEGDLGTIQHTRDMLKNFLSKKLNSNSGWANFKPTFFPDLDDWNVTHVDS